MSTDPAAFNFDTDIVSLARRLIGARLLVRGSGGTVIETEAYGRDDPASHSFRGMTPRNRAMFGPPGTVYVYLSYGMHLCLNIVGLPGEAVLIRALLPDTGVEEMALRRELEQSHPTLASGPGRLAKALGVTLADNGTMVGNDIALCLPTIQAEIMTGPRIGISRAVDLPWRFGLSGSRGLSRPFPKR